MIELPPEIASVYRPATDREIHSWSFGRVSKVLHLTDVTWESHGETLRDQAIFGATRSLVCACGQYSGVAARSMVCDRCGVKVVEEDERERRFGHIELMVAIPHPCGDGRLTAIPVLPSHYSFGHSELKELYEAVIGLHNVESPHWLSERVEALFRRLVPIVACVYDWTPSYRETLARGLALTPRVPSPDPRCVACGFPFESSERRECPCCGKLQ